MTHSVVSRPLIDALRKTYSITRRPFVNLLMTEIADRAS
jgi:hypothetical protein